MAESSWPSSRIIVSQSHDPEQVGIDRISDLPEDILQHILSFLPTKQTVRTSVLSSRWRSVWISVPVIDLGYEEEVEGENPLHNVSLEEVESEEFSTSLEDQFSSPNESSNEESSGKDSPKQVEDKKSLDNYTPFLSDEAFVSNAHDEEFSNTDSLEGSDEDESLNGDSQEEDEGEEFSKSESLEEDEGEEFSSANSPEEEEGEEFSTGNSLEEEEGEEFSSGNSLEEDEREEFSHGDSPDEGDNSSSDLSVQDPQYLSSLKFSFDVFCSLVAKRLVPTFEKFCLKFKRLAKQSHLNFWVQAAILHNIKEIDICIASYEPRPMERTRLYHDLFSNLPTPLLTCKTLIVLKLSRGLYVDVPESAQLPNLKTLHLKGVLYNNDNSVTRLLSSCPVLEDFEVQRFIEDRVFNFGISIPTVLEINAPVLERLHLIDLRSKVIRIKNLPRLKEAVIDVRHIEYTWLEQMFFPIRADIITALHNVATLRLCRAFTYCFGVVEFNPPIFSNLTHLELKFESCIFDVVTRMIEDSPKLEVISIVQDETNFSLSDWKAWGPTHVPKCLLSHLKEFHFNGFGGSEEGELLLKYILKNARVLEKMKISSCNFRLKHNRCYLREVEASRNRIEAFHRGSPTCELTFILLKGSPYRAAS